MNVHEEHSECVVGLEEHFQQILIVLNGIL